MTTGVLLVGAAAGAAIFIASGAYNIAADDSHTAPVSYLLGTLRERSMETRAARLQIPDLSEQRRIVEGAGNYQAMCVGCHLAPQMEPTELSRGLYPAPPNLSLETVEPDHAFWAIKHGIKASGMPAWGKSMNDEAAWNLTAFLVRMPKMDIKQYEQLVASSGGHSHGAADEGEADEHGHGDGHEEHAEAGEAHDHSDHEEAGSKPVHEPAAGSGTTSPMSPADTSMASHETVGKAAAKSQVHADGHSHTHTAGSK
ncbi:MAG: cytochrome c [Pseudomonadota bacterium]|nr:cytochrome c [Pseudomonadota bacterium]